MVTRAAGLFADAVRRVSKLTPSSASYFLPPKGSVAEVVDHVLRSAQRAGLIGPDECSRCAAMGDEIGRMLGGWIKYLARCDWKDRGRFKGVDAGRGR